MPRKLILCSSITYALKGRKLLSDKGYKAYVVRPPLTYPNCGCGYCISLKAEDLNSALGLLEENGVKIKDIIDISDDDE